MTSDRDDLPSLPRIALELLEDVSPRDERGFLRLVRRRLRAVFPDGSASAPFDYDEVARRALDAVVIVAHFVGAHGERRVYLRSAVRPPLAHRDPSLYPPPGPTPAGGLWELPAGLVEPDERGEAGVRESARRELAEELGFAVPGGALVPLGPSTFPAPAVLAERHFYFEVTVEPGERGEPTLDGSALERGGVIAHLALGRALELCRAGVIEDTKTELALRRLRERYP